MYLYYIFQTHKRTKYYSISIKNELKYLTVQLQSNSILIDLNEDIMLYTLQ